MFYDKKMYLFSFSFLGPPGRGERIPFPTITCQGECVRLRSWCVWNNKKVNNRHSLNAQHGPSPYHSIASLCLWICSISLLFILTCLFSSLSFFPLAICIKKPNNRGRQIPSQRIFLYWGGNFNTSVAHQDCGHQLNQTSGNFRGQVALWLQFCGGC
jgi:hypothetical protein